MLVQGEVQETELFAPKLNSTLSLLQTHGNSRLLRGQNSRQKPNKHSMGWSHLSNRINEQSSADSLFPKDLQLFIRK